MAISWPLYTNLQKKGLCWLLYTNLQNKTHYRWVTPFARSLKSQHKFIVSNSGWKCSPIINKQWTGGEKKCSGWKKIKKLIREGGTSIRYSRVGNKFRFKMTLLNFWIKLTQKDISELKNWKLPSNSTYWNWCRS